MNMFSGPPTVPTVSSGIFKYASDQNMIIGPGFPRYHEGNLRTLIAGRLPDFCTKQWMIAQLQHYGLPVPEGTKAVLAAAMRNALAEGKFISPPAWIRVIEGQLKAEYAAKFAAAYPGVEDIFARDKTPDPVVKANYSSAAAFLRWYFLDVQGKVDPVHAPKALVLKGLINGMELVKEATKVGGIFLFCDNPDEALVIGCDHAAVLEEARKITKKDEPAQAENQVLQEQGEASARQKVRGTQNPQTVGNGSFTSPIGGYWVECEEIENGWPDYCAGAFTLDILPDSERTSKTGNGTPMFGDFSFGFLEGLMRFRLEGEEWEDFECDERNKAKKRKLLQSSGPSNKSRSVQKNIDPYKLHFIWRGQKSREWESGCESESEWEEGEGEIQLDDDSNFGVLQFLDKGFLNFEGTFNVGFIGKNIRFSGSRAAFPNVKTNPLWWGGYSKLAHEKLGRR